MVENKAEKLYQLDKYIIDLGCFLVEVIKKKSIKKSPDTHVSGL
ncbi:hypothetical protein VPMS16_1595 [Vibrio sp. 16]|nr:hypothetical protein VPMS16_1595 [Vibrio sp. 16]